MPTGTKSDKKMMEHAKEDTIRAMEAAKARFNEVRGNVKKYMKDNPVRAAMLAAGIGAAIGAVAAVAVLKRRKGNSGR